MNINLSTTEAPPARSNPIKNWAKDDRPREKLLSKGAQVLSDAELLAILLGSGSHENSALDLGREIMRMADNSLSELCRKDIKSLKKLHGIGTARAVTIAAAMELCRRRGTTLRVEKPAMKSSIDVINFLRPLMEDQHTEYFYVLFLNHANKVLHHACISHGGMTHTTVDTRVIFQEALVHKATKLMLCHNHPSGNLHPSNADLTLTRKLKEVGKVMDIEVLDHIILADHGYYSFREDGMM